MSSKKSLIEKVKSYWPDFVITDSSLQNPTQTFVYSFYSRFCSEYEKNLFDIKKDLLNQEPEPIIDNRIYTDEIYLAIKLKKISKQMNGEALPFYLTDIFEPQPRKTLLFFSLFMNLLIYMKTDREYVDEISEVVKKTETFHNLYHKKQILLEEIANMNLIHFKLLSNIKKLKECLESISAEHETMLKHRAEREFEYQHLLQVKNKLIKCIKTDDENLKVLRKELTLLQEQVIEDTDVEVLEKNISTLEKEFHDQDVERSAFISSREDQEEITQNFEKCLAILEHCIFNSNQLNDIQSSVEDVFNTNQKIIKLKEIINNNLNFMDKVEVKVTTAKKNILMSEKKQFDLKLTMEENIKNLELQSEIVNKKEEEAKSYENNIEEMDSIIKDLEKQKQLLVASLKEEYSKLLEKYAKIYNRFNNALMNIDNRQNMDDKD